MRSLEEINDYIVLAYDYRGVSYSGLWRAVRLLARLNYRREMRVYGEKVEGVCVEV